MLYESHNLNPQEQDRATVGTTGAASIHNRNLAADGLYAERALERTSGCRTG